MATIDIKRSAATILSPLIDDNSKLTKVLNGDDYIVLSFSHESFVEIQVGDYIEWNSITYTLKQAPQLKKLSLRKYQYDLRFEGPQADLLEALYLLDVEGEFFLTGTAEDFIDLMITNLNRVHGGGAFTKGSIVSTDFKNLSFNNEHCLTVLQRICEEYDLEYSFTGGGGTINLSTEVGTITGLNLEYYDGLRNITRQKVSDKDLITRLYAYGSERNLDYNYGTKRLVLPSATYPYKYMENNVGTYGVREGMKIWDDIYPHFEGTVTSTSIANVDKIIDTGINFNLNDYLILETKPKIVFQTGDLAGMEFEIISYNNTTKEVYFKVYTDEYGNDFPSTTFKPEIGDEFTFVDIKMPAAYISAAEADLAAKALEYITQMSSPNVLYDVTVDWHKFQEASTTVEIGDVVLVTDPELAAGGLEFRILELTQSLANQYKYTFKIGESILIGYLSRTANERAEIKREVTLVEKKATKSIRRGYLAVDELQDSIFDTDGYFDPDNIKPLSIETAMLTVGSKSTQLTLSGVLAQPNYQGVANYLYLSTGSLIHFTIDTTVKTWTISPAYSTTTLTPTSVYYLYVKCLKSGSTATWDVSTAQKQVDPDDGYYYFLVGILSSVIDDARIISWLYGQTTVNGKFIKTGRIESLDSDNFFDLDSGEAVFQKATLKTSDTGQRIEIDSSTGTLKFYNSSGSLIYVLDDDIWFSKPGQLFAAGSIIGIGNGTKGTFITDGAISVYDLANLNGGYYLTYNPTSGEITYYGATSDIRLKKNVARIENALEKVLCLHGFTYNLNKEGQNVTGQDGRPQAGLSAQEVNKVLPEAVSELGESGYLKLDYDAIHALLIEAIKEHRKETTATNKEVLSLRNEVKKLRGIVQDLLEKE